MIKLFKLFYKYYTLNILYERLLHYKKEYDNIIDTINLIRCKQGRFANFKDESIKSHLEYFYGQKLVYYEQIKELNLIINTIKNQTL